MELWISVLIMLSSVVFICFLIFRMKKETKKNSCFAGIILFALMALLCLGYSIISVFFVDTVKNRPAELNTNDTNDYTEITPECTEPRIQNLKNRKYNNMPVFSTLNELSEYLLYNLINEKYSMEFYLNRDMGPEFVPNITVLDAALENTQCYYLFSTYKINDMLTEDRGDNKGVYSKITLVPYHEKENFETKETAREYTKINPPPEEGFIDAKTEKEYMRKIHDYIIKKTIYSKVGYEHCILYSDQFEGKQEAYNVLGLNQNEAVCAGYARAVALIAQYAGIDCAWGWGNEEGTNSHAWNILYPCDGSEPVIIDATWDDVPAFDRIGQTETLYDYFYIPLSEDSSHNLNINMQEFLNYLHE